MATTSDADPTPAPTQEYRVELDAYEGPLDLLLYLVKRHEIDLNDIPIAELTEQYLEHIRLIEEIDIEMAGDFLVMAATLLEIKSQMLVPYVTVDDEEESDGEASALGDVDPRYELVQQLLAYKRFKDAAVDLEDQLDQWQARYPARATKHKRKADDSEAEQIEWDMDDVDIHHLCEAFTRILDSIGRPARHEVEYDDTPISLHEEDIMDRLLRDGQPFTQGSISGASMTLRQIFEGRKTRGEMIGLFLALLELTRQRKVRVLQQQTGTGLQEAGDQPQPGDAIRIIVRDPSDQEPAVNEDEEDRWRNPDTGEIEYEWPSEEVRLRAEKRKQRQAERLAKIRRGESVDDDDEDDAIDLDQIEAEARGEDAEAIRENETNSSEYEA